LWAPGPRHPGRNAATRAARHAHTCRAPSGSAAGASPAPPTWTDALMRCFRLSPFHSFSPSWVEDGAGNAFVASAAAPVRRSRHRPPLRHSGIRELRVTALPGLRPSAQPERLRRVSVSRPIFGSRNAECASLPPFRFCAESLLQRVASAAYLPNRLSSKNPPSRWLTPADTSPPDHDDPRSFFVVLSRRNALTPPGACLLRVASHDSDAGRAAVGRPSSFNSGKAEYQ
jgi:hypothetical protein